MTRCRASLAILALSSISPLAIPDSEARGGMWRVIPVFKRIDTGRWLILSDRGGLGDSLARLLEKQKQECVIVQPGDRYQALAPSREG